MGRNNDNKIRVLLLIVVHWHCSKHSWSARTHTKKDFLQLSATSLGAKVVNTNLVPKHLTVAARATRGNKSYSPFLCWSHFNLISWKRKLQHIFHTFRNLLLKEVKKKYFFNENITSDEVFFVRRTISSGIKISPWTFKVYFFSVRSNVCEGPTMTVGTSVLNFHVKFLVEFILQYLCSKNWTFKVYSC